MNEYLNIANDLIKFYSTFPIPHTKKEAIDLSLLYVDGMVVEWKNITNNFVSGSVTNDYKLEHWQKVKEVLLDYKIEDVRIERFTFA